MKARIQRTTLSPVATSVLFGFGWMVGYELSAAVTAMPSSHCHWHNLGTQFLRARWTNQIKGSKSISHRSKHQGEVPDENGEKYDEPNYAEPLGIFFAIKPLREWNIREQESEKYDQKYNREL